MITDFNEYWAPKRKRAVKKWPNKARSMMKAHKSLEERGPRVSEIRQMIEDGKIQITLNSKDD